MRVLLSNASFKWGGVHQITDQLATGLRRRGHDVAVYCRPGSLLEQRLRARFPCQPLARGMDFSPLALVRLTAALRRLRPDVVLTLMDKDLRLTGAAARILRIPVVARRANDQPIDAGPYSRLIYRHIAAHHVANSEATRQTMLRSAPWLEADDITVIHNGIDLEAFDRFPTAALPVDGGGVVFGFVGRLDLRKGVRDLLDAWPLVVAAEPSAQLLLVGRGGLEAEVSARVATMSRATFLGFHANPAGVLRGIDVAVVPSHWEGFGLVAAEALAASKPVIAANASSLPEIVRDQQEGWLVPARDPAALARAMITAVRDEAARERMGAAGRRRIEAQFSIDRMVDDYERLLLDLTNLRLDRA